jgi:hypothetical protein
MGFLSKLMKNPIVQMALPMALTGGASALFGGGLGAKLGIGSLFSGMNPLMANALKQTALGYGTAALSGSRRPGKAAMAAGLTSIPFSYLSAANAARGFNAANAGATTQEALTMQPGGAMKNIPFDPVDVEQGFFMPSRTPTPGLVPTTVPYTAPTVTAQDILFGRTPESVMMGPSSLDQYVGNQADAMPGFSKTLNPNATGLADEFLYSQEVPGKALTMPSADIFTKAVRDKAGNIIPGEFTTNFLPTAVSQAAGLYAGRDTPEEEFEAAKRRRRKELAFLYGVDESLIEGEMDNPFYTGAMMNAGGIASLNMDMGGNVSGPGGPKDDMIDAKLSDGEFVMTAKAVENFGNGDRYAGAKKMYQMMNKLDPESETMSEV